MINSGKLRHRIVLQKPVKTQDQQSGAYITTWQDVGNLWCAIEPISAREFIASQVEDSKISTRITIRYTKNINHSYRIYHQAKDVYYNIHGILADQNSGLEYITLPCSEGLRDEVVIGDIPVNLTLPEIVGVVSVGNTVTAINGLWANDPVSYKYQWYIDDIAVVGENSQSIEIPNISPAILTVGVKALNVAGESLESVSEGQIIA